MPTAIKQKDEIVSFINSGLIDGILNQPHRFIEKDEDLFKSLAKSTNMLYKLMKQSEPYSMSPLDELLVADGFDVEQIWEQLQLQNEPLQQYLEKTHAMFMESEEQTSELSEQDNEYSELEQVDNEECFEEQELDLSLDEEQESEEEEQEMEINEKTLVDDDFFSLREMEKFADEIDKQNSEEEEDLDNISIGENDITYRDFFENEQETAESTFEKKQKQMKTAIEQLEQQIVSEKPWMLQGEVSANKRPVNSLLEEHLEVDYNRKEAPPVENSIQLEDLIKDRIKNDLFDDLIVTQAKKASAFNSENELSQEKDTRGLDKVYEQQIWGSDKKSIIEEQHTEIKGLFMNLCNQLDSLCNWHYKPPANVDLHVQTVNAPTIAQEEQIPATVNPDSQLLAPKQVFQGKIGKSEREKTALDRKRDRNHRKEVARKKPKKQETAMQQLEKDKNVTIIGKETKQQTSTTNFKL